MEQIENKIDTASAQKEDLTQTLITNNKMSSTNRMPGQGHVRSQSNILQPYQKYLNKIPLSFQSTTLGSSNSKNQSKSWVKFN